ncbi:MAG: phosphopantothenoylcysteine decarboxylase [Endomicrobium sp.]|jgi:phosphopantothenoylcysteine synthetase/decarboxylase|uniref:phosphopantothenoylcysteine decarboxylase domain-containing protein n=1 Tax=Candidatus Endomicrobiellum cubanum TaxID=3242325 RepID=UPI00282E7E44|nr:phosphopantothenoylcysteine decarboxylase [Endomicrobium sp.]
MSKKITFLILSGPTKEHIDPVRYISNESSGQMGSALAEAAVKKGYDVIFISGPAKVLPKYVKIIDVITALDMFKAAQLNFKKADIVINAAAVADYRPTKISKHKIKKNCTPSVMTIKLKQNPDIIKYCGENKHNQVVVGFALETKDLIKNALLKLKNKKLDLIVANGIGTFNSKNSTVSIITSNSILEIKNRSKNIIAEKIINETIRVFKNIKSCKVNS